MHTFTVQIQFSPEVLACAADVAETHGDDAARAYLERKVDRALEGGYFNQVEVSLSQIKCIFCDEPAVSTIGEYGDQPGPKCRRHARPAGQNRL